MDRAARLAFAVSAAAMGLALLAVAVFTLGTIGVRLPYWGEAEVVFEAARLRSHFALFVDPLVGAAEYGEPPSRYWVTYPPILSYAMSTVPKGYALLGGRVLACGAWFGALAWLAGTASAACRRNAIAAAAYVAGLWVLANFATVGRPDAVACALAAVGLGRAVRDGRLDGLSIVLLVLASATKPTLLGLPAGAIATEAIVRRRASGIALAILASGLVIAALWRVSGGAVFDHVVRSNAQPLTIAVWLDRVPGRIAFFGPLFVLAAFQAWRLRADHGIAIGLGSLGVATAWTLVAIAKTGSAANYWMEPCIAAVALLARADGPYVFGAPSLRAALLTAAVVVHADVASVRAAVEHLRQYREEAAFVATLGCDGIVASDEQGIELAANGRILAPAYQMAWQVHAGRFPAELWQRDLDRARCFVASSGALEAAPEVDGFVTARFAFVRRSGSLRLLRHR